MNIWISILFRAIPLLMGGFCLGLGIETWVIKGAPGNIVVSPVLIALSGICLALFCTAAVIIKQLIKRYNRFTRVFYPILGYAAAVCTFLFGLALINCAIDHGDPNFIAGHVVCGVSFVIACVSTVATASLKFTMINENSGNPNYNTPLNAFSKIHARTIMAIPFILSIIAWGWAFYLLSDTSVSTSFVAGHVFAGLAAICSCLIALVVMIVKQIQNTMSQNQKKNWLRSVIVIALIMLVWGISLSFNHAVVKSSTGYIVICLSLVCFSISSKVMLLELIWKSSFALANRIPIIPIMTCLACLMIGVFMFESTFINHAYYVPAHVCSGLGAVCFTLFSIVSILESGTAK